MAALLLSPNFRYSATCRLNRWESVQPGSRGAPPKAQHP